MTTTGLVWFRNDLRIEQNPAWASATEQHDTVSALVVLNPKLLGSVSSFRRNQYLANVDALANDIASHGGTLTVASGDARNIVPKACEHVDALHVNRTASRYGRDRDNDIATAIGCELSTWWGTLVSEPGTVLTGKGTLSKVFTPFSKKWFATHLTPMTSHLGSRSRGLLTSLNRRITNLGRT